MRVPAATAIDTQANGRPRLALTEPSTGSITTRRTARAAELDLAALLRDRAQRHAQPLELGEHRVLRRLVDRERRVAALALAVGDRPLGRGRHRATAARAA